MMDKLKFMTGSGLLLSLCSVQAAKEPNVLIIMTDEHSIRTLGCYRALLSEEQTNPWNASQLVETPNIDLIAKRGVLCANTYCASPVSSPSRSAFVTGFYPQNNGVTNNDKPMKDEMVTFAQTLLNNGYKTGYAGKWHLDDTGQPDWSPVRKFGFDDNKYMFNSGHWKNIQEDENGPFVGVVDKEGKPSKFSVGDANENPENYASDFLTTKAIDFIHKNKNDKFCYMLSFPDPHGVDIVREPYASMYADMTYQHPASVASELNGSQFNETRKLGKTIIDRKQLHRYWGMVKCIDDNIGRLINTLKENGLWDNTIVVFTADHGDMLGEHGYDDKGNPFEMSAKIPFVIAYPGVLKAGSIVDKLFNNIDFTPTILSLMNVRSNIKYEGKDFSETLKTNRLSKGRENVTVFRRANWIAATDGKYKLIYCQHQDQAPVLVDIETDPNEMKNIYDKDKYREAIRTLAKTMYNYGVKSHDHLFYDNKIDKVVRELKQDM